MDKSIAYIFLGIIVVILIFGIFLYKNTNSTVYDPPVKEKMTIDSDNIEEEKFTKLDDFENDIVDEPEDTKKMVTDIDLFPSEHHPSQSLIKGSKKQLKQN